MKTESRSSGCLAKVALSVLSLGCGADHGSLGDLATDTGTGGESGSTGTGSTGSGSVPGGTGQLCAEWDMPGDFAVLERTGEGQFETHVLTTYNGSGPALLEGDYDGNGERDLFVYGFNNAPHMMLSGVDNAPVPIPGIDINVQIAGVGDVDGDGADDIVANVVYDGYGLIRVGPDGPEVTTAIPESIYPLAAAGDFDGDGQVDLVGGYSTDGYRFNWGNGTLQPELGPSVGFPAEQCGSQIAVLVVPREEMTPALVVATGLSSPQDCLMSILIAIPEGRDVSPTMDVLEQHPDWGTAAAVDWNGDGHVDIVYGTSDLLEDPGTVRVALADGAGGFAPSVEELILAGRMEAVARNPDDLLQLLVEYSVGCIDEDDGEQRVELWLALMVRPPGGDFGDYETIGALRLLGDFESFTDGLFGSPPGMLFSRVEPSDE